MKSNLLKKIIASAVVVSLTFSVGSGLLNKPEIVQADDFDDDKKIFKGSISIDGTTTHMGRKAVSVTIPKGMKIKDVDVENEPHDDIEDVIVGGKVIIYGLRDGMTYRNLVLVLEDFNDVEYRYNINQFTVKGNNITQGGTVASTANTKRISDYLKNVYKNVFGREIDGQGLNYWTQKLSSGEIELEDFFKNLLSESEFMQVAPKVEDKIKKLYAGIFQREADKGGLDFWTVKYKQELREEGNEREALRDVIDEMTDGQEFKQLLIKLGLNND